MITAQVIAEMEVEVGRKKEVVAEYQREHQELVEKVRRSKLSAVSGVPGAYKHTFTRLASRRPDDREDIELATALATLSADLGIPAAGPGHLGRGTVNSLPTYPVLP